MMASCTVIPSGDTAPSLVKLRIPFRSDKQNENCVSKIILVIDRSGSMCGGKEHFLTDKFIHTIKIKYSPMETSSSCRESHS
jgi:hypothetical protein